MHALDVVMTGEKFCHLGCVSRMRAHSPGQGAHSAEDQPAVEGRGDRAALVLNIPNALKEIAVSFGDHDSAENVAMPAKVFRCRVKNKIGAEIKRPLKNGRPGVVADTKGAG